MQDERGLFPVCALEANPNLAGVEANIRGAEELLAEKRRHMI